MPVIKKKKNTKQVLYSSLKVFDVSNEKMLCTNIYIYKWYYGFFRITQIFAKQVSSVNSIDVEVMYSETQK